MTTSVERERDEIVENSHDVEKLEDIARTVPEARPSASTKWFGPYSNACTR